MRKIIPRLIVYPIGPGIAYVPLTQGQWALIDAEDMENVGRFNWQASWSDGMRSFYASRSIRRSGRGLETVRMHRLVLQVEPGLLADHINANTLDNRRCNLRPASHKQNGHNRRVNRNSLAGLKGVSPNGRKYAARIKVNGRDVHLGSYPTPESAHEAYCEAAGRYYQEFARTA